MAATSAASEMSSVKRRHHHHHHHHHHLLQLHSATIWLLLLPLLVAVAIAAPTSTSQPAPAATSTTTAARRRCAHKGIAELIRTSPVIVKALAARVFTDAELADAGANVGAGADDGSGAATSASATILITLTPETIYKGASLLKMANGPAPAVTADLSNSGSGARRNSFTSYSGASTGAWSDSGTADSAYHYEGQLNATVQPLHCFDANMLKMLPTELIAFGKLQPASASGTGTGTDTQPASSFLSNSDGSIAMTSGQIQAASLSAAFGHEADVSNDKDVLHISINGLHRWTPQFENHIWKHLGWDDWSDFTLCSVTCGKGVQQRFRRCLLDNPLVDISRSMNLNLNLDYDEDDEDDEEDADDDENMELEVATETVTETQAEAELNVEQAEVVADEANNDATDTFNADNNEVFSHDENKQQQQQQDDELAMLMMQPAPAADGDGDGVLGQLHKFTPIPTAAASSALTSDSNEATGNSGSIPSVSFVAPARNDHHRTRARARANNQHNNKKKKRKSAKSVALSTLLCEGYNIEQRNCNSFECNDDISDLLKFYKKLPSSVEAELGIDSRSNNDSFANLVAASDATDLTTAASLGSGGALSTPSNMGYIRSWRNMNNFTLMITLRAKNDTKNTSTIFSIRNSTHNLYLDACNDGLRLYQERDNTTEMLPLKFNLYDYRWHQVAISIQNGDFISIYVDCLWTNSFVVSKRLFTLPLDADVEIGRGFNGELQQLLVLPEHQERLQCSNKRTSINEVKRYIIDTFIEDYNNN